MRDNQGGFSLIEFVIVIAILGILLTIGIFATNGMRARSRDHQRHLNSETIAGRLETYYKVNTTRKNSYPSTDELNSKAPVIIGDNDAMIAPGSTTRSLFSAVNTSVPTTMTTDQFIYQPFNSDDALCTGTQVCVRFVLYYRTEIDNAIHQIESIRQQ